MTKIAMSVVGSGGSVVEAPFIRGIIVHSIVLLPTQEGGGFPRAFPVFHPQGVLTVWVRINTVTKVITKK